MDSCPPELHYYICGLACNDDGSTARSLSLVSKYFHQIAQPFLYRSLCLSSGTQIASVAKRLKETPAHRRTMYHLYIYPLLDFDEGGRSKVSERDVVNNIVEIITLASPTLLSLTLLTISPSTSTPLIARLFRLSFPSLTDLTISGHYPFPSSRGNFPVLERLHLFGNRNPHGLMCSGSLESSMPQLTHLRVSGLNLAITFTQELFQAFENSMRPVVVSKEKDGSEGGFTGETLGEIEGSFSPKLGGKLCQVLIQCGPEVTESVVNPSQSMTLKDQLMVQNLEALEEYVGKVRHRTRFKVVPRRNGGKDKDIEVELKMQWASRVAGEVGCWGFV